MEQGARRRELGICCYWLASSCCSRPYMKSFSFKVITFLLSSSVHHPLSPCNCFMDDFGMWLPSSSWSISIFNIHTGDLAFANSFLHFKASSAPLHFPHPRELVIPTLTALAQNSQTPGFHAVTRIPILLTLPTVSFPLHMLFDFAETSWPLALLFPPSQ